jgi:hypothetical protein
VVVRRAPSAAALATTLRHPIQRTIARATLTASAAQAAQEVAAESSTCCQDYVPDRTHVQCDACVREKCKPEPRQGLVWSLPTFTRLLAAVAQRCGGCCCHSPMAQAVAYHTR